MKTEEHNQENNTEHAEQKNKGKFLNPLSILKGEFLQHGGFQKQLPFVFFLALLAAFYLANKFYGENKVRQITHLKEQLKAKKAEHISLEAELMELSKQSEVAKRVKDEGLELSIVPPQVIEIEQEKYKKIY